MRAIITLAVAAALTTLAASHSRPDNPMIKKITPLLYVEEIESLLPFWVDRLGFTVATEVPEGERLGFVILQRDGAELMLQTRESVENDVPALADMPMGGTMLFIEVESLEPILEALEGVEPVVPRRQTFYGADEVVVRDPVGNVIGFAAFGGA